MLPTLQILGRTLGLYGIMIVFGLIVGILIMVFCAKQYHIKYEDALFSSFFGGIGFFVGAKLLYLLLSLPQFLHFYKVFLSKPSLLLDAISSGYVFYGGLLGAILGFYIYSSMFHLNFIHMLDLAAPSIPIIHGFGRIGCFLAGCCYGIPYHGVGHIVFQHSLSAPNHIELLPTQLIESCINFLAGGLLLLFSKQLNSNKSYQRNVKHTLLRDIKNPEVLITSPSNHFLEVSDIPHSNFVPGRLIGAYLIYYTVFRFIMEFFRGDVVRGIFFGISTSQWFSILIFPIGIYLMLGSKKRHHKTLTS